jgi:hypothetical protein
MSVPRVLIFSAFVIAGVSQPAFETRILAGPTTEPQRNF